MIGFFKSFFGNSVNDSQIHEDAARAMANLDIDMALAAHQNWKLRLQAYINGSSNEDLSAETICFDDRCDLGQWIHGNGKATLGRFPGFTALMGQHKMFHYAASNVVALVAAGKDAEAQQMLEGQFEAFSRAVVKELQTLRDISASRRTPRQRA